MLLAGDIGGTKTILALYKQKKKDWVCYRKETFASADFDSFAKLLDCFLSAETDQLQSICIGVAGPVVNGDCVTTNLPWELKRKEISSQTGAKHIRLINDLEATAWGVMELAECDFVELNREAKESKGNLAVLAAGTGLGEALLVWCDDKYYVVATEGGHTDFAPRNELEIGLLRYLIALYPEHVSNERVICGKGLVTIYQYLKSIQYAQVNRNEEHRMSQEDPAVVISENGMDAKNELCAKALEMFCEIYGAEAGNLALKCLPNAGIVLAGGIAVKNLPSLQKGDFMRGYLSKGRYKAVLQDFSVKVCLNPEAALIGAISIAKKIS